MLKLLLKGSIFYLYIAHSVCVANYSSESLFPLIPTSSYSYTNGTIITRTESIQEQSTFNNVVVTGVEDNEGDVEYFTNDSNGLFSYGTENINDGDTSLLSPPIKILEANTEIGQTINSSGTAIFTIGGSVFNFSYSSSSTVVGEETITVPAGTFDAVRVQVSISLSGIINSIQNSTYWYAENIGLIRDDTTIDGEILNDELETFFIPTQVNPTPEVSVPLPIWSLICLSGFIFFVANFRYKS